MQSEAARVKTLVIGCDYQTFYCYKRVYSKRADLEIIGFVHCHFKPPPIKSWTCGSRTLNVISLTELEQTIKSQRVKKCLFNATGIPMRSAATIVNMISSTGICEIEFVSPEQQAMQLDVNKPLISFSSLVSGAGKTNLARYFCDILVKTESKVAVIIPIINIPNSFSDKPFVLENGFHLKIGGDEAIPKDIPKSLADLILKYQKNKAYVIFVTTNVNRAIISAEQLVDIILFDSCGCSETYIKYDTKFCVVTPESIESPMSVSGWPGIVNVFDSTHVIIMADEDMTDYESYNRIRLQLGMKMNRSVARDYFLAENKNHDFLPTRNLSKRVRSEKQPARSVLNNPFAKNDYHEPSLSNIDSEKSLYNLTPFLTDGIDDGPEENQQKIIRSRSRDGFMSRDELFMRASSPVSTEVKIFTKNVDEKIQELSKNSEAEYVILDFPDKRNIILQKHIIRASKEVNDIDGRLFDWIKIRFVKNRVPKLQRPPLQKHFQSQVDVLLTMVEASSNELSVTNNESANREAFARLFLQSHIPPGFRVTAGEILDCSSNSTGQLDCVIANDECPSLTLDATGSVIAPILADSVLGVVEVKTLLNVEGLKKALSQLRPVKALMPSHETLIKSDGKKVIDPLGGKIITGIFAYKWSGEVESKFGEIISLYPHVADFIVLPNSFAFFSAETLKVCNIIVDEDQLINGYVKYTQKGLGLALIFGIFNAFAAIRQFSAYNYSKYLSGAWGTEKDTFERETTDVTELLKKMHQTAIRETDEEGKESLNITESAFLKVLDK